MMIRKPLLISLITVLAILRLGAQDIINVFGLVNNVSGDGQEGVTINVSAFFADSTFFFESTLTDTDGDYQVDVINPISNQFGFIQVDMVDCNNTVMTQWITVEGGVPASFEANFTYCSNNTPDSCDVFILIENVPGTTQIQLTAWTPNGLEANYLWSTGETTQTIIPTASGPYSVIAEFPQLGCSDSDSTWVFIDSTFCWSYIIATPNQDSTWNLEVITQGVAPFTYLWDNGATTPVLSGVGEGTYCVTVTDASGCTNATCTYVQGGGFCEAYIAVEPAGGLTAYGYGEAPFTYVWNTGETTQSIYPNVEGLFCVTVTDANGCWAPTCYDYWFPMDSCFAWVNAFMADSNTFALEAWSSGFGQSWSYVWSTGETTQIIYPSDPFQSYCVTVTDDLGCESNACYDPSHFCYTWIDLQYLDTTTAVLTAISDPIFNIPGAPEPLYVWSNGDSTETITVTESGYYCVTVSIGSGCLSEACLYVDFDSLQYACSAWVVAYPDSSYEHWYAEVYPWGFGEFTYLWHNGDTTPVTEITHPQAYACVTVTSSLGCETVACLDSFNNPCTPWIDIYYDGDSSATLTAVAWHDPAQNGTYQWSTGESTPTINVTEEGFYCVTVSAGGCQGVTCVDVDFNITKDCGVYVTQADTTFGTLFFANAWGEPPFQYLWDNGSTAPFILVDFGSLDHCVTITDANGCVNSGCSYSFDSCYAEIVLNCVPDPQLYIYAWDPIIAVQWQTNDPGDTMLWLNVTEPGTYCASYVTLNGCVGTQCYTVDSVICNPIGIINGYVFNDQQTEVFADVSAFKLNNDGSAYELVATSTIGPDGFYYFGALESGVYIVKADPLPNTPTAEDYVPTYHANAATWSSASPIVVPSMLPVTNDITLIAQVPGGGPGVIGGILADPGNFTTQASEVRGQGGLPNVVILLHDVYGNVIDYTTTLEDGSYRFPDLALGTYRLKFDIPGIASQEIWVTLTADEPSQLSVNIILEESVAVDDVVAESISLYPNPATTQISMSLPGDNVSYNFQLVDVTGKIVTAGSAQNTNGILTVDVSALTHGLYQINLVSNSRLFYGRFVRQE
jgi:hypothetical protein